MLKGITMMIVLLMKACIESSRDNGFFVSLICWIDTEGRSTTITTFMFYSFRNTITSKYHIKHITDYFTVANTFHSNRQSTTIDTYFESFSGRHNQDYLMLIRFLSIQCGFEYLWYCFCFYHDKSIQTIGLTVYVQLPIF